mgnify:CR=1 FL=1
MGTGIWGLVSDIPGPLLIPLVLGVVSVTLLGINQFLVLQEHMQTLSSLEPKVLESRVRTWLDAAGYSTSILRKDGTTFYIEAKHSKQPFTIAIFQEVDYSHFITVLSAFPLQKQHLDILNQSTAYQKGDFYRDINIELVQLGVEYQLEPEKRITTFARLAAKGADEAAFFNGILFVSRAVILTQTLVERNLARLVHDRSDSPS